MTHNGRWLAYMGLGNQRPGGLGDQPVPQIRPSSKSPCARQETLLLSLFIVRNITTYTCQDGMISSIHLLFVLTELIAKFVFLFILASIFLCHQMWYTSCLLLTPFLFCTSRQRSRKEKELQSDLALQMFFDHLSEDFSTISKELFLFFKVWIWILLLLIF